MQKRVLITGGDGGLAQACKLEFQAYAWEVLAPSRSVLDVTDSSSVQAYVADCGPVDLLICAAGLTEDQVLGKMTEPSWDAVMEVNLKGAFRCARALSGQMLRRRSGHVVFVSSYSAFSPHIGQANYAAAKAGLVGMAKSLAKEWGARSVRVNVVVPGFMETKMTAQLPAAIRAAVLEKHSLGELNTPPAAAGFIRFLEESMPHTSGQVFHLDSRVL